jgi:hypothetical protein
VSGRAARGWLHEALRLYAREARREMDVPMRATTAGQSLSVRSPYLWEASGYTLQIAGRNLPNRRPRENRRAMRGRGRPAKPDRYYAELARDYVAIRDAGSSKPIIDLARKRREEPTTTRAAIHTAGVRGLLERVGPGIAGGTLTAQARDLLNMSGR